MIFRNGLFKLDVVMFYGPYRMGRGCWGHLETGFINAEKQFLRDCRAWISIDKHLVFGLSDTCLFYDFRERQTSAQFREAILDRS